jgi:hypothetical protein
LDLVDLIDAEALELDPQHVEEAPVKASISATLRA